MLDVRRIIGPRAQRPDAQVGPVAGIFLHLGAALNQIEGPAALDDGHPGFFGVHHVAAHLVEELFQGVRARYAQEAPVAVVGVQVSHYVLLNGFGIGFGPLRRAQQAGLLAVPGAEHDGALGPPAGFHQLAQGAGLFQFSHHAAEGVVGPVHPGVVVVAAHYPLVGQGAAFERSDDVVHRLGFPVEGQLQMHLRRPGPDVVRNGQRPAPVGRGHGAGQGGQQGLRIAVGNGQTRDLRERGCGFVVEALGVFGRAVAGREGVAGVGGHVEHRAALSPGFGLEGAFGVHVALPVAIVLRVGINQAADGTLFGGHLGLDAAPRAAILGNYDFALHVDASALQLLVILRHAVVHEHQLGGHVAVAREAVVGGQLLGGLARGGILSHRLLGEAGHVAGGRYQFQRPQLGRRKQHVRHVDARFVAPAAKQAGHELGVVLVVG